MYQRTRPRVAVAVTRLLRAAVGCGLLLACAPACSTAMSLGCVSGIAAGVALAGLSAVAAKSDTPQIDAGTAVLGGSIFGAVCGCTAAGVTEALAKSDKRSRWSERASASDVVPAVASAPAPSRLLSARASLDGLSMTLLGTPESGSTQVTLQFKRFGASPEIANCHILDLELDGQQLHFPVQRRGQAQGTLVAESAQAKVAIAVIQAMQAAQHGVVRLCGLERQLNVDARSALGDFVHAFSARAPGGLAAAAHEPAPTHSAAVSPQAGATFESNAAQ